MGGPGSGRPKTRERRLVENCEWLDINQVIKYGFVLYPAIAFIESDSTENRLSIHYSYDGTGQLVSSDQKISLTPTHVHLGGIRYWFICPKCGVRVRKLYKHTDTLNFYCRTCCDLTYQSQKSHPCDSWLKTNAKRVGLTPKQYEKIFFA